MSYAPSFYADQQQAAAPKPIQEQQEQFASEAAIPASTPIAEDVLSPTQIQEAIRLYRNVLSNSAPSSPVRPSRAAQAPAPVLAQHQQQQTKPEVHSNYYGGGPVGVPQSYLMSNLRTTTNEEARFAEDQRQGQQLMEELENLRLSQEQQNVVQVPIQQQKQQQQQQQAQRREQKSASKMYDPEESGYCFNRKKADNTDDYQEYEDDARTPEATAYQQVAYTNPPPVQQSYQPSPRVLKNLGPSEYIGMSNDNRFIYDARQAPPAYNIGYQGQVSYQQQAPVAPPPPPPPQQQELHHEPEGATTTEDLTQLPGASPMIASRFRGLIRNASTPTRQATTPIVVERVHQEYTNTNNNYGGAFAPIGQPHESEYQLPVLNDLASCIENY